MKTKEVFVITESIPGDSVIDQVLGVYTDKDVAKRKLRELADDDRDRLAKDGYDSDECVGSFPEGGVAAMITIESGSYQKSFCLFRTKLNQ